MKMKGRIDPAVPLDYIELQIYPSHNRYEAFVCSNKRAEKVSSGTLERLLLHLPRVKDLSSKGLNTNFKILPPDNVNDAEWFTTATFTRFLHIIGSVDILGIGNEITQLVETRKFQFSLSRKAEVNITSSVDSKNELLRAVDLRLTVLKDELVVTFDQAISGRCSIKDISDLENFSHHFGAKDIRDSLQKVVDMSLFPTVEDINNSERNDPAPKPLQLDPSIKNIVSLEEVVQSELQNSLHDENSSLSSEEDQPSVERSHAPTRSSTPRRSASLMRRIQIGRSGSHRATALTIKSLNHFPLREKVLFSRDQASNNSDEDDPEEPAKKNVLRMSVQDKISLFESKQRDQKMNFPKTKTLLNKTIGPKKSVLRRWSSGMGEIATQSPDTNPETSFICHKNLSPEPESDNTIIESQVSVETEENIKPQYSPERRTLKPLGVNVDTLVPEREECFDKHPASIEWNQQKEAELNLLFMEMMENKPVSKSKIFQKQNGDAKLQGEVSGKRAEKEEQFKVMQRLIDERNTEMVSTNVSDANSKQKTQKKSNPLSNSIREASKPSVLMKTTSKTSPLPATRKSWSSTQSPRPTGASPARNRTGPTPTSTTSTSQKVQSASSTVRSTTKSQKSQPQTKTLKATPPDANRILTTITQKNQSTATRITKATKAKVRSPEVNAAAKPSFYNKVTKKSSVVPLETKPFLHKGSGTGSGVGQVIIKTKFVGQLEETSRISVVKTSNISGTLTQTEENEVVMTTEISEKHEECEATESPVVSPTNCEESTNSSCTDSLKPEINAETEELMISPTAWVEVEIEDQSDIHEEEVIPWKEKESPMQIVSPVKVVAPAGTLSPRVRRSLSQMLLEDRIEEADIGERGNAEHPPALIYIKNSPKGLKKLFKFARKTKPDFHPTRWSSASVFLEGDDAKETKGQPNIGEFTSQNHPRIPEVSASINATKATRSSLFSLSTFKGSKTNESNLP